MNWRYRIPLFLLFLVLPLWATSCKKNTNKRIGEGARYVKSKPDKAIAVMQGVLKDEPDNYRATYYMALAYRYKKDWPNAEKWLKTALKVGKGRNGRTIRRFLREVYLTQAKDAAKNKDLEKQIKILWEAARLERKIKDTAGASIEANATLFKLLSAKVDKLVEQKKYKEAIAVSKEIRKLWYDAQKLRAYRRKIKTFIREDFRLTFYEEFKKTHRDALIKDGTFLAKDQLLSATAVVDIPDKKTDPRFDPKGEKYMFNVEAVTKLAAQKAILALIYKVAGKKEVSRRAFYVLNVLSKDQLKESEKKWVEQPKTAKVKKYSVSMTIPLKIVEDWTWRIRKLKPPKKKPVKKGDKKPEPKKDDKKKGDEKPEPKKDDKKKGDKKPEPKKDDKKKGDKKPEPKKDAKKKDGEKKDKKK